MSTDSPPNLAARINLHQRKAHIEECQCSICGVQIEGRRLIQHMEQEHPSDPLLQQPLTAARRKEIVTACLLKNTDTAFSKKLFEDGARNDGGVALNGIKDLEQSLSESQIRSPSRRTPGRIVTNAPDDLDNKTAPLPLSPPARRTKQVRERKAEVRGKPSDTEGFDKAARGSGKLFDPTNDITSLRNKSFTTRKTSITKTPQSPRVKTKPHDVQVLQHTPSNQPKTSTTISTTGTSYTNPTIVHNKNVPFEKHDSVPADPSDENAAGGMIEILKQPETRPISKEQLFAEVRGIYAGLVMVEAKCIQVDTKQAEYTQKYESEKGEKPPLNNEQYQALIALHRTLLHEHHDFFLASQHPSAAPPLKKLAIKYQMPARLWKHAIHSFLELLRHRLPASYDHMLAFVYLAYSMVALLLETVPTFKETWLECLGDLGRYRMAIEKGDARDRGVWQNVSRHWYIRGIDSSPGQGRLFHHLAILSRPFFLNQLYYYCKSLSVTHPFPASRESILTTFVDVAEAEKHVNVDVTQWELSFVKSHGYGFQGINLDAYQDEKSKFLDLFDNAMSKPTPDASQSSFIVKGAHIAVCSVAAIWQYGSKQSRLRSLCKEKEHLKKDSLPRAGDVDGLKPKEDHTDLQIDETQLDPVEIKVAEFDNTMPEISNESNVAGKDEARRSLQGFVFHKFEGTGVDVAHECSIDFAFSILKLVLQRGVDVNMLSLVHVYFVMLNYLKDYPLGMAVVLDRVPWQDIVDFANTILNDPAYNAQSWNERVRNPDKFPMAEKRASKPLSEDWMLRGLDISRRYFPAKYFQQFNVDLDERLLDLPSFRNLRVERVMWLITRLAKHGPWIHIDEESRTFSVTAEFQNALQAHDAELREEPRMSPVFKEEEDLEMEPMQDEDSSMDDAIDENSELAILLSQRRNLRKQLDEPAVSKAEEKKAAKSQKLTLESFKPNYTAIVVDTNSLVKNPDLYQRMIDNNQWSLILPYSVLTELYGLVRNDGTVSQTSQRALDLVEKAVLNKKRIKVITAKGSVFTDVGKNYKEKIESYRSDTDGRKNLDDVIINTAKRQGEEITTKQGNPPNDKIIPVVLITDDTVMRVKAYTRGVPAISTQTWSKHLAKMDESVKLKTFANTFQMLRTHFPRFNNEDPCWRAVMAAGGDPELAAKILEDQHKGTTTAPEGRKRGASCLVADESDGEGSDGEWVKVDKKVKSDDERESHTPMWA